MSEQGENYSMSKTTTRRAILACLACLAAAPAIAVPALADPSADAELLALGVVLEEFIREWHRQRAKDRDESDYVDAKMEAAGFSTDAPLPDQDSAGWWDMWHKVRREVGLPVTCEEEEAREDSWDRMHDRMYPLVGEIFSHKPKTIAGLAVIARAITLSDSHLWTDWQDEGNDHQRTFIEAVCSFAGVTPVPVEEAV
jgi:hypothetical protein